jgi:hypothetical protein
MANNACHPCEPESPATGLCRWSGNGAPSVFQLGDGESKDLLLFLQHQLLPICESLAAQVLLRRRALVLWPSSQKEHAHTQSQCLFVKPQRARNCRCRCRLGPGIEGLDVASKVRLLPLQGFRSSILVKGSERTHRPRTALIRRKADGRSRSLQAPETRFQGGQSLSPGSPSTL